MRNKRRNRARKLFIEWKKINPQFFKNKSINKDLYKDAVDSLVSYFRTKRLSLIDCKIELSTDPIRWTYISICASIMASYMCGLFMPDIKDMSIYQILGALFIWLGATFLLACLARITINKIYLDVNHFLQIALERYIELYEYDLKTANKLVELFCGQLANIPANAELIYSDQMQLSKYYQNAFVITVDNNGQKFDYVLYSNDINCSIEGFVELCEKQIGKTWDIDKYQVDIVRATIA